MSARPTPMTEEQTARRMPESLGSSGHRRGMADYHPVTPSGRGRGHDPYRTVHPHEKGGWQARLPEAVLPVAVTGAGNGTPWCRLTARPSLGIFTLTFAPWPAAIVLRCPLTALPAQGRLSVRDVRLTTRMGRTVRYLIPAFTTP